MFLPILASLVLLAAFSQPAAADLRITAKHHSFGGVNYPLLQFYQPQHRDDTIREIFKSGARVIRLFIRPDSMHPDPEGELGEFDKSLLDQFDDALAAIHHLSKGMSMKFWSEIFTNVNPGQMKVIIAPHDAHALRGTNDVPCDAYCKKLDGAFLDFYSGDEFREHYKTRLEVFFKHYESKNFGGRPWSDLPEVILGVDLQNQPFTAIWPIPSGESWLCDIANHLKFTIGLDKANIAVISGGVSGAQEAGGSQNFPDSVFECNAIDVIGIHGYFSKTDEETAGTAWANLFIPGNTLTSRAQDRKGKGKLLLVEEWGFVKSPHGLFYKKEALFDQGNALNFRGIPWIYSHLTSRDEAGTARVNPLRPEFTSWTALKDVLRNAYTARSNFKWNMYLPPPAGVTKKKSGEAEWRLQRAGLTNLTALTLNPYILEQSDCTFGCLGHLCDAADGCEPDLICKNSVCQYNAENQPGQIGDQCNSKKLCQSHLLCSRGKCQACAARSTMQPIEPRRKPSQPGYIPRQDPRRRRIVANDPAGSCYTDSLPDLFTIAAQTSSKERLPICLSPKSRGNPCESSTHCDANAYCNWGVCTPCAAGDHCLGARCRSNNKCKTGYCNSHGRCDYPGQKKIFSGVTPGGGKRRPVPGVPKGHERGPAKVRDEAMRINIPKDKPMATATA